MQDYQKEIIHDLPHIGKGALKGSIECLLLPLFFKTGVRRIGEVLDSSVDPSREHALENLTNVFMKSMSGCTTLMLTATAAVHSGHWKEYLATIGVCNVLSYCYEKIKEKQTISDIEPYQLMLY